MGTRSAYIEREWQVSDLGQSCAFVDHGCTNKPSYSVLGTLVVPKRLRKAREGSSDVPLLLAFCCDECMPHLMEWMPRAEIIPFDEVPPRMVPAMMEYVVGGWLREARFTSQ